MTNAERRAAQRAVRDEKIRDLWGKGLSRALIAERLGLSRDTVSGTLTRLGLSANKDRRL